MIRVRFAHHKTIGGTILDSQRLPNGWHIVFEDIPKGTVVVSKAFPDPYGFQVELTLSQEQETYQVESMAYSVGTDPTINIEAETLTLSEAMKVIYQQCQEWDEFALHSKNG